MVVSLLVKDYKALIEECMKEVIAADITPGNIVKWGINHRARSRWGLCTRHPDGTFEIEIAYRLLADDNISDKSCKDTIIHEILHSCRGCQKHTGTWKKYAEHMNALYGYNIKRITSAEEKGVEKYEIRPREIKYIYKCRKCGQIITKKQKCKFTRYYKHYGCGICGERNAFIKI